MKKLPPFPYSRQSIDPSDIEAVVAALQSDFLTQGPRIPEFEARFAELHQAGEAIAVANATAALHIACLALGVGPGDAVWTAPNSFLASANCARYCGADIDFVDIDPDTRNMSVPALAAKLEVAKSQGKLPKVVIPIDFAGYPCDLRDMRHLADRYGFSILEDASHAVGATREDQPVGSEYSDIAVFSFHAVKIVTTAEGGICTTRNPDLAKRLRLLRSHGMTRESGEMTGASHGPWYYEQICLGYNYRITELQAALGISQLARMTTLQRRRDELSMRYDRLLAELPLRLPARSADRQSAHHLYAVEITDDRIDRRRVFEALREAGIGVNVHYIPIHLQPDFKQFGFRPGDFPISEAYYARAISLPLFPAMTDEQQDYVVTILREALQ
jgi:UDP-4-amino-4,6-dideoxy-N-acetyl-beta-L-altrosamine transaminase